MFLINTTLVSFSYAGKHYQKQTCEKLCEKPCENQVNFTHFSYDFHIISHMFHMLISHAYEIAACEEYMKSM